MINLKETNIEYKKLDQAMFKGFLGAVLILMMAYANVSYAKTLTVSEDFRVSIESISGGDIDQSLMNFMGPDTCALEYMVEEYGLNEEDVAEVVAADGPVLDENESPLKLANKTMNAIEECAGKMKVSPMNVLQIYAQVF